MAVFDVRLDVVFVSFGWALLSPTFLQSFNQALLFFRPPCAVMHLQQTKRNCHVLMQWLSMELVERVLETEKIEFLNVKKMTFRAALTRRLLPAG